MGILVVVAGALFALLLAPAAYASRSYPTGEEADQKLHAIINNETNSIRGLIDHVSPHHDKASDANIIYFAYHGVATAPNGYYGFIGTMDVYGFPLSQGQGSAAAVWISDEGDGARSGLKNIMIGWDVLPDLYGDSKTHFYTKWTNDGYQSTGCFNTKCNGFVPEKGAAIAPGDVIDRVSSPKGEPSEISTLKSSRYNGTSGDWLVHTGLDRDPQLIGRFPRSLFTGGFADKAVGVLFGGVAAAPLTNPAPMGSGYLPTDVKSAASISNIQLIDQDGRAWPVTGDLPKVETNPSAYAVSPIVNGQFFYGGHQQPPVVP